MSNVEMLKEGCNLNKEKYLPSAVRFENRLREPAGFAGLSVREAKPTYFSRWLFSSEKPNRNVSSCRSLFLGSLIFALTGVVDFLRVDKACIISMLH
jgi:hypothetical protein